MRVASCKKKTTIKQTEKIKPISFFSKIFSSTENCIFFARFLNIFRLLYVSKGKDDTVFRYGFLVFKKSTHNISIKTLEKYTKSVFVVFLSALSCESFVGT